MSRDFSNQNQGEPICDGVIESQNGLGGLVASLLLSCPQAEHLGSSASAHGSPQEAASCVAVFVIVLRDNFVL